MWIGIEGCSSFGYTVDFLTREKVLVVPYLCMNATPSFPGATLGKVTRVEIPPEWGGNIAWVRIEEERGVWGWYSTTNGNYYLSDQNGTTLPWKEFP